MNELTFQEAVELARAFREAGGKTIDYIEENSGTLSHEQIDKLTESSMFLLMNSAAIRTAAVSLLLDEVETSKEELIATTRNARDTLAAIQRVGKIVDVVTGLVELAGAVISKNPVTIAEKVFQLTEKLKELAS